MGEGKIHMQRILIVEDEKMIRGGIKTIIESSGIPYDVIDECRNGKEAVAYLEKTNYDLVLTDIRMPIMNGMELNEWIGKHFEKEEIPFVVAISGYAEFEYIKNIMKGGAIDYILKPIDREELKKTLWHVEELFRRRCNELGIGEELGRNGETQSVIKRKKMQAAVDYILQHYRESIDMVEVSNHVSMNYTLFSSEFKKYTHCNFTTYLKNLRIMKAKKMIRDTDLKINEISFKVGFEDARRFAKVFKKETGMTPKMYRMIQQTQKSTMGVKENK